MSHRDTGTTRIGGRVLQFDTIDSTNTYISQFATDSANDGLVVIADEQTAGRGQPGRRWFCRRGEGVLMSVLVFPPPEFHRIPVLTAWAAVSVCDSIEAVTGKTATIKWPNDVFLDGRKVCGILTERGPEHAVVGIGLNVNQSEASFQEAELPHAISLAIAVGYVLNKETVARQLMLRLDETFGRIDYLEQRWRALLGLMDQTVRVEQADATIHGVLRELTFGALRFENANGAIIKSQPEAIRHLTRV